MMIERVYTLTINRAACSSCSKQQLHKQHTATAVAATAATTVKANQWVQVSGRWQYNDSLGHAVKNIVASLWCKWYYLGADGNMQTKVGYLLEENTIT